MSGLPSTPIFPPGHRDRSSSSDRSSSTTTAPNAPSRPANQPANQPTNTKSIIPAPAATDPNPRLSTFSFWIYLLPIVFETVPRSGSGPSQRTYTAPRCTATLLLPCCNHPAPQASPAARSRKLAPIHPPVNFRNRANRGGSSK